MESTGIFMLFCTLVQCSFTERTNHVDHENASMRSERRVRKSVMDFAT